MERVILPKIAAPGQELDRSGAAGWEAYDDTGDAIEELYAVRKSVVGTMKALNRLRAVAVSKLTNGARKTVLDILDQNLEAHHSAIEHIVMHLSELHEYGLAYHRLAPNGGRSTHAASAVMLTEYGAKLYQHERFMLCWEHSLNELTRALNIILDKLNDHATRSAMRMSALIARIRIDDGRLRTMTTRFIAIDRTV
jgi:hypothetical protein